LNDVEALIILFFYTIMITIAFFVGYKAGSKVDSGVEEESEKDDS